MATVAVLQQSEAGAGYVLARKAQGFEAAGAKSCSVTATAPALTTKDHVYIGPMFKNSDGTRYLYSEGYAFRTEELAARFVALRSSAPYQRCKEKQDDEAQRQRTPANYVKLAEVSFSDPTGHIPAIYREVAGGPNSAGKKVEAAVYDRFTFQHGRVVVVLSIDTSVSGTRSRSIEARTLATLRSFDKALDSRLAGA
ncbi:MAG: hypothetical protein QOJ71_2638 [Actinomycetota bacterium]|nr:hypothetical protein [Actinomycetota bacterium]